jgi:hypothetical protein
MRRPLYYGEPDPREAIQGRSPVELRADKDRVRQPAGPQSARFASRAARIQHRPDHTTWMSAIHPPLRSAPTHRRCRALGRRLHQCRSNVDRIQSILGRKRSRGKSPGTQVQHWHGDATASAEVLHSLLIRRGAIRVRSGSALWSNHAPTMQSRALDRPRAEAIEPVPPIPPVPPSSQPHEVDQP